MRRKSRVPAFYGKNVARQVQRRYLSDKKLDSTRINENRKAAGDVICMCYIIALNDERKVGEKRLGLIVDEANRYSERFETNKMLLGLEQAKKKLDEELDGLLPEGFLLPITRVPQKDREWAMLAEQRDAAEIVVKIYSLATRKTLGFGAECISRIAEKTKENFREFGEWAKDGDYYGYKMLARRISGIIREPVDVVEEENGEPIFGKTLF